MTNQEWKRHKFETEGLCLNCVKRPAGGEGGTRSACARCAMQKRKAEWRRRCRLDPTLYFRMRRRAFKKMQTCTSCGREREPGFARCRNCRAAAEQRIAAQQRVMPASQPSKPDLYAMTEEQWVQARRPPSSVTWIELSTGASNT